jgi:tRNA uridine 5-carbamoylmethylation protein Kti12
VKKLVLMQGAPGCGKSTMAEMIVRHWTSRGFSARSFSADDYWYEVVEPDQPDKYSWNPELSGKNHVWNQHRGLDAMQHDLPVIDVDNTNTLRKEALPYIVLAGMFGYGVEAVRIDPGVEVCIARQADRPEDRRVPEDVIRTMHERMQPLLG